MPGFFNGLSRLPVPFSFILVTTVFRGNEVKRLDTKDVDIFGDSLKWIALYPC